MKSVHFILQGKGGVGKTFIASLLAQYHLDKGPDVVCLDTDPVNATFSGFTAFKVRRLDLMDGSELNPRKFDAMVEMILTEDKHFIIDNGAASFLPMSTYLFENAIIDLLAEHGKEVNIHTVLTGNMGMRDTVTGFVKLAENLSSNAKLVVWLNEFLGKVELDGKRFEEMKAYEQYKEKITSIVRIPKRSESTFGKDIGDMLSRGKSFAEVHERDDFHLMAKQRLVMVQREMYEQLDCARI